NMSHEIRTPLNGVIGFTDLLLSEGAPRDASQRRDFLESIRTSGRHLLTLINDILDLSKIEAGQLEVESIAAAPHEIISQVFSVLRVHAQEKGLSLNFTWSGGVPKTIMTDPVRLRQMLMNIVGNAIKFTGEGEVRVDVRLDQSGQEPMLLLDVVDTGVGIPPHKLESIFDPFVQADNTVTRRFGGTGLGLAISRRIATALGGDIRVRSQLGKGTVFSIAIPTGELAGVEMLPAPPADALTGKVLVQPASQWRLPPCKVLLVEDGVINRKLIVAVLGEAGAEVATAENGLLGVARALKEDFDLILMDMQMPLMDGYTATSRLREQGLTLPIIALTAHAMKQDEQKCKAAGCSGY
ncbi:MAG: response regulator, partial [Planctomycetales bacterium]|nr:response regulator [Planctomycetales bacterium]